MLKRPPVAIGTAIFPSKVIAGSGGTPAFIFKATPTAIGTLVSLFTPIATGTVGFLSAAILEAGNIAGFLFTTIAEGFLCEGRGLDLIVLLRRYLAHVG